MYTIKGFSLCIWTLLSARSKAPIQPYQIAFKKLNKSMGEKSTSVVYMCIYLFVYTCMYSGNKLFFIPFRKFSVEKVNLAVSPYVSIVTSTVSHWLIAVTRSSSHPRKLGVTLLVIGYCYHGCDWTNQGRLGCYSPPRRRPSPLPLRTCLGNKRPQPLCSGLYCNINQRT